MTGHDLKPWRVVVHDGLPGKEETYPTKLRKNGKSSSNQVCAGLKGDICDVRAQEGNEQRRQNVR